jgi:hypothetical protein
MVDEEPTPAEAETAPHPGLDADEPPTESANSGAELDEPDDDLLWPL